MVFEFGSYKADIDVEKTRHFYKNAESVSKRCSCDGCTNFEEAVAVLPQSVIKFFADLGIDMRKVCECLENNLDYLCKALKNRHFRGYGNRIYYRFTTFGERALICAAPREPAARRDSTQITPYNDNFIYRL